MRVFRGDDHATRHLRRHSHIQNVRDAIASSNPTIGESKRADFHMKGDRGRWMYWNEGLGLPTRRTPARQGNIALAYLGSYDLEHTVTNIDSDNVATVRFRAQNPSNLASALRPPNIGYTRWWHQNVDPIIDAATRDGLPIPPMGTPIIPGPMAEHRQVFEWSERIRLRPPGGQRANRRAGE